MSLKIGDVELKNNVLMAPMAGITDKSFRRLCIEQGAGLTYSEMISGKSILYNNIKHLLDNDDNDWAIQLFGREPNVLAEAARRVAPLAKIIDINMGCPAPKIVKNGEGSALMKEPALAGKIIEAVARAVNLPVTIKIRKGFTSESANAAEIAKIAQESGAKAVTVHGRTRDQFYSGKADWDAIAEVKAAVSIPVIANGDVVSPQATSAILSHTKCDGLMIARAACGNPWLFSQITNSTSEPDWETKKKLALRHARMVIKHKGEHIGVLEMRKHFSWYIKGLPSATKLRTLINKAATYRELEDLLNQI